MVTAKIRKIRIVCDDAYRQKMLEKYFHGKWKASVLEQSHKLNVRHVQPPKEYKKTNGDNYNCGFRSSDTPKWSAVQIKRILTHEVYIETWYRQAGTIIIK
ncbi:MAG: hypothetical protein V8S58_03770 [Lachnospiraceae bacterium]